MPQMWIGFDPSNPKCQSIKEVAFTAMREGAIGLTITSSEVATPVSPVTMETKPRTVPAANSAQTTGFMPTDAEIEVRCVWGHLYSGIFSRKYLMIAAKYGEENDTEEYTFSDLDYSAFENGIDGIRAAHRNVSRAMKVDGVKLFEKRWDSNRKCQVFKLRKACREEILMCAAADNDL